VCEARGSFSQEDIEFQEKIAYRTGLGDDTAVVPAIQVRAAARRQQRQQRQQPQQRQQRQPHHGRRQQHWAAHCAAAGSLGAQLSRSSPQPPHARAHPTPAQRHARSTTDTCCACLHTTNHAGRA
jgi:hypothetical protein